MKSSNNHGMPNSKILGLPDLKEKLTGVHAKNKIKPVIYYFSDIIKNKSIGGEVIRQSSFWIKATILGLMGSTVFGVGWLAIAKTDEVVTVSGKLEPLGSVQEIQMPLGGIASEILVKDGEEVISGQILMRLDAEATQQRQASLSESYKLKNRQLELKNTELDKYLLANTEEIKMLKGNFNLQKEILSRYQKLKEEGATSELQYLQQMNRVNEINGKLRQVEVNRLRQKAALEQQIQQIKAEIEEIESRLTEVSVNLRYQVLRSPIDGIVFDLQPRGKGYAAQSTETVMKIVPRNTLEASIEIPSRHIGFVKVGMNADLSIDSFPATDFGVIKGKVKSIGSDVLPPSQIENRPEYRYPATIKLSSQKLEIRNGEKLPLQVGMSLTSNIKLRKVSYLQLLLGTFQDKVDSIRKI